MPENSVKSIVDADGENKAVREFLRLYGATPGLTYGAMMEHLESCGHAHWPSFVSDGSRFHHLTKSAAQQWLRHLFMLELGEEQEVAAYQFQDEEGKWRTFINEQHYKDTVEEGAYLIRALYARPICVTQTGGGDQCFARQAQSGANDSHLAIPDADASAQMMVKNTEAMAGNPLVLHRLISERNEARDMVRKVEELNAEFAEQIEELRAKDSAQKNPVWVDVAIRTDIARAVWEQVRKELSTPLAPFDRLDVDTAQRLADCVFRAPQNQQSLVAQMRAALQSGLDFFDAFVPTVMVGHEEAAEVARKFQQALDGEAVEAGQKSPANKMWRGLTAQDRKKIEDDCEMMIGLPAFEAIESALRGKNDPNEEPLEEDEPEWTSLTAHEIVGCLADSGCIGSIQTSSESGPYRVITPTEQVQNFVKSLEMAWRRKNPDLPRVPLTEFDVWDSMELMSLNSELDLSVQTWMRITRAIEKLIYAPQRMAGGPVSNMGGSK